MSEWSPPSWFWQLLDDARPSLQALVTTLESLPRKKLVAYAHAYDEAMMAVREPWNGLQVDGIQLSEDDTADFTAWVVGEGRVVWQRAVAAEDLRELVHEYWAEHARSWDPSVKNPGYAGYQSCRGVATAIFASLHGGELADALENYSD